MEEFLKLKELAVSATGLAIAVNPGLGFRYI
jgi:hypothetical protein